MRAISQYTIHSLNDVVTSATAPTNPYLGQLWVDTSQSPPKTMVWNGAAWKAQNGTDDLASGISTITTKQQTLETNLNGLTSSVSVLTQEVDGNSSSITTLSSQVSTLTQTATDISAEVAKKVDETYGSASSLFGWSLKSTGFYVYSNATTVMSIISSGLTVNGAINATSGTIGGMTINGYLRFGGDTSYYISANHNDGNYYINLPGLRIDKASSAVFSGQLSAPIGTIGGFNLTKSSISSSKTSYNDSYTGVYIGTSGIGLGAGAFYVTSAGKLYANDAEISGKITATSGSFSGSITSSEGTIGGFTIGSTGLTNSSGGSYIEIKSGDYTTRFSANTAYSMCDTATGWRGWRLGLDQLSISDYSSSKFAGVKIMPTYLKRLSYTGYGNTTVSEGCITTISPPTYNADNGTYTLTGTPFIIGTPRAVNDSPYATMYEWGAYMRFAGYTNAELVYDSYYGAKWYLRDISGSSYDLASVVKHVYGHKFYFWTYTSSVSNDSRASITKTTHGLSVVNGAIVIPRENSLYGEGSSLSGDNNLINKRANYGVYISGTTVYVIVDTNGLTRGFYCLIYGY